MIESELGEKCQETSTLSIFFLEYLVFVVFDKWKLIWGFYVELQSLLS